MILDQEDTDVNKRLKEKFNEIREQILNMPRDSQLFKNHQLPLARVKKIMKSDQDMISSETPVLFAKACQIFIIELTQRAWAFTEEAKRRTLQKNDVMACIVNTSIFDFLIDIFPKEEINKLTKKSQGPRTKSMLPYHPNEGQ